MFAGVSSKDLDPRYSQTYLDAIRREQKKKEEHLKKEGEEAVSRIRQQME